MGTALIAYLAANPQVLMTVGNGIIGLIMKHGEVSDLDKDKLKDIITRLDVLLTKEERIASGLDG